LHQAPLAEGALEIAVTVQLNDESGAAGLAFCSDGGHRHYGFYPTGGHLRLTRFDGPDVLSWNILHDKANPHYVPGGWNTLRVRVEGGNIAGYVNDQRVVEIKDAGLSAGQVGLVKFRETKAQFKGFQVGRELAPASVPEGDVERIQKLLANLPPSGAFDAHLVEEMAADAARASAVARERASELEREADRLRALADAAHSHRVIDDLKQVLARPEDRIDLFRAGLLVAKLDNEEVDVEAYRDELDQMGRELAGKLKPDSSEGFKLELLRKYMFEENGFHGSRGEYYNRANSYLNEVLDDREGLPITLAVVYLELARHIGLNVEGLGFPGHFVVGHLAADGTTQIVDVYEGAKLLTRDEANRQLKETTGRDLKDNDFAPATKRGIVTRMLHNLLGVSSDSDPKVLERYLNAILAIEPESGQHRWLRAIVRFRLQNRSATQEDIDWLLANKPAGVDLSRLMELQRAVEGLE
jgi:serine protease Do